jgi:phosphohistidine phosphatase
VRVTDTVEHLGGGYGRRIDPVWDRRLYLASTDMLIDVIRHLPETVDRVLLIGHNPGIEDLVLLLVAEGGDDVLRREVAIKYPTASVAELRFDDGWEGVAPRGATLKRFIRPRDLDPSLGPDQP